MPWALMTNTPNQSHRRRPADLLRQPVTGLAPGALTGPTSSRSRTLVRRPFGSFGRAPEGLKNIAQGKRSGVAASATRGCRSHSDSDPVGVAQQGTRFLEPLQGSCLVSDLITQGGVR